MPINDIGIHESYEEVINDLTHENEDLRDKEIVYKRFLQQIRETTMDYRVKNLCDQAEQLCR